MLPGITGCYSWSRIPPQDLTAEGLEGKSRLRLASSDGFEAVQELVAEGRGQPVRVAGIHDGLNGGSVALSTPRCAQFARVNVRPEAVAFRAEEHNEELAEWLEILKQP